ncbi:MAG: hypothetical protein ACRD3W_31385 [Terriglobales bacterium]
MPRINRNATRGDGDDASASPILVFIAITLLTVLAIAEIDLHRDTLRAMGLIIGSEGIEPLFVGP